MSCEVKSDDECLPSATKARGSVPNEEPAEPTILVDDPTAVIREARDKALAWTRVKGGYKRAATDYYNDHTRRYKMAKQSRQVESIVQSILKTVYEQYVFKYNASEGQRTRPLMRHMTPNDIDSWCMELFIADRHLAHAVDVVFSEEHKDLVLLMGNGDVEKGMDICYNFFRNYKAGDERYAEITNQWRRMSDYFAERPSKFPEIGHVRVITDSKGPLLISDGDLLHMIKAKHVEPGVNYILPFIYKRNPVWEPHPTPYKAWP